MGIEYTVEWSTNITAYKMIHDLLSFLHRTISQLTLQSSNPLSQHFSTVWKHLESYQFYNFLLSPFHKFLQRRL